MSLVSKLSGASPEDVVHGIARNLEAVLNAKRGHASALEVFGLGDHDVFDEAAPLIFALAADMTAQVKRFEPRVVSPRTKFVGREGWMWARFELTGEVEGQPQSFKILFHVVMRRVRVLRYAPSPPVKGGLDEG